MLEKLRFYMRHSLNDLRVNGQRTVFALLCIAAGVAAIVSLQTVGVMIEDTLTGSLQESNGGDLRVTLEFGESDAQIESAKRQGIVASGGQFSTDYITLEGVRTIESWLKNTASYGDTIDAITYRQAQTGFAGIALSVPDKETYKPFTSPIIIEPDKYPLYGTIKTLAGQPLAEVLQNPTDIVLSENLADDLDANVGDTITINGATQEFTLTGIVSSDTESGFINFEANLLGYYYANVSAVESIESMDPGASAIFIRLSDTSKLEQVATSLERRYPYLDVFTTSDLEEMNKDISSALNDLVIVMGLISLLIGGIGIVNTMLVMVSRRTVEVAVLKTVGLEAEQVTTLFLVEAIIMGVIGSLMGIVLGWGLAYVLKGVAEQFVNQSLSFRVTLMPAINGIIVGVVVTTVFGFLPTLAAGQVRPNLVLRPSDAVIPKAGWLRSFVALLVLIGVTSLVAQGLTGDLLSGDVLAMAGQQIGAFLGFLMGMAMNIGGFYSGWARGDKVLRVVRWIANVVIFTGIGFAFGRFVPAVLILFNTFIIAGILYIILWALIWSIGGGALRDLWFWKLPRAKRKGFWAVPRVAIRLPVWIFNSVLIVFMTPIWLIGRILQRLRIVDLTIALRSMLASKSRGASTLLALSVGVFTLSLITMLTTTITEAFEELLEQDAGGNVIIFAAGGEETLVQVTDRLDTLVSDGVVESYAAVGAYDVEFVSLRDVSTCREREDDELRCNNINIGMLKARVRQEDEWSAENLEFRLGSIDARDLNANLPEGEFVGGAQLSPANATVTGVLGDEMPGMVVNAYQEIFTAGIDVGDELTFNVRGSGGDFEEVTFKIVGMIDRRGADFSGFGNALYTSREALHGYQSSSVNVIAQADDSRIRELRRSITKVPLAFVLETKDINDLFKRVINNFTSFPILVAALSLFTGGVVIANSVALATMERRREIGIMKAVGLQRERVLAMLLLEYGIMGLIGGLMGVGLGASMLWFMLNNMFPGELNTGIPFDTAFLLMGLCVLIALVASVLTAWGASGEKPLNVLRYE